MLLRSMLCRSLAQNVWLSTPYDKRELSDYHLSAAQHDTQHIGFNNVDQLCI